MRDIRNDLQERLDDIAKERARLQAQVASLEILEGTYKAALREEDLRIARLTPPVKNLPFPPTTTDVFIGPVIKRVLKAKERPLALDEIRDEIVTQKTFDFGDKKPGRSVHFGLVSLVNGGEVERLPDGRFVLPSRNGIPVQETTTQ